ncbi:MAG: magnesium transporter [Cyanobacteria bacterium REEB67]|nr:magnesium transporter [Cyanobacteria bacterium REEB67]
MISPYSHSLLHDLWTELSPAEQVEKFKNLSVGEAKKFLVELSTFEQARLLSTLPDDDRWLWLRALAPDDAADVLQQLAAVEQTVFLEHLDQSTRHEVSALLAYRQDVAGGLMSPRYVQLRDDMSVPEALAYLHRQAVGHVETLYYVYILDGNRRLTGVTSLRELFVASPEQSVREIMSTDFITAGDDMDQEHLSLLFAEHNLLALPIVDHDGRMKGIVTIDDIVDVVEEEVTEDIQKMGGSEAFNAPYLEIGLLDMIRKRAGWLVLLFLSEMLTANAMSYFENEIARAVILAVFVPLIISSGGNSGSQATTLVIRAMALGQIRLRDWWRVLRRELIAGLCLGSIIGVIGLGRILGWQMLFHSYGPHYQLIAMTVGFSLVGIVAWGSISGAMLPFILKRVGFDPASASAPFVATLVDVTGLIIYFTIAANILRGTLL